MRFEVFSLKNMFTLLKRKSNWHEFKQDKLKWHLLRYAFRVVTDIQALVPVSKFLFCILSQVIFSIVLCSLFYYSWRIYLLKNKRLYPGTCSQTMVLGNLQPTKSKCRQSGAVGCTVQKLSEGTMVELKIWYYFLL